MTEALGLCPIEKAVLLLRSERRDLAVVGERESLPATGGFYRFANGARIHARLKTRPVPALVLDHGLAIAIAMLAEGPPIAELPLNRPFDLSE